MDAATLAQIGRILASKGMGDFGVRQSLAEIDQLLHAQRDAAPDALAGMSESQRHNAAMLPILRAIVEAIGTEPIRLLIFAESLVCGLFLLTTRLGGDEPVIDTFAEGLRQRMAEQRLGPAEPGGHA